MSRTFYPINLRVFLGGIGVLLFLILTGSFGHTAPDSTSKEIDKAAKAKIQKAYGKLPLYFIRNNGQVDGKVKFYEKGSGHATFFTKEGVYLLLTRGQKSEHRAQNTDRLLIRVRTQKQNLSLRATSGRAAISSPKQPATRNPKPIIRNSSNSFHLAPIKTLKSSLKVSQKGKVNYFTGNDPEKWRTDIPTYRAVVYKEIYPGIDMKFYGSNRELEYDIIVSPGADP